MSVCKSARNPIVGACGVGLDAHFVGSGIAQSLQHLEMVSLAGWLLEHLSVGEAYHRVGADDEGGLFLVLVHNLGSVHALALLCCCLQHIFPRRVVGLIEVFGEGGGDDFDVGEAELRMRVSKEGEMRGGGGWHTLWRSCFRLGEAEARITRLLRRRVRAGSSRRRGPRGTELLVSLKVLGDEYS